MGCEMLEAPTGRLKWERNDQVIRVELPASLDWSHVRRAIISGLFSVLVICLLLSFRHGFRDTFEDWWFVLVIAPLLVAVDIWNSFAPRTILTLTPSEMTLNKGIRETHRNTRVFANGRIHNLRFRVSHYVRTAEHELVKDSIICDVEGRTIAIMSGISKEEATTLIEKMMAIYKFPNTLGADNPGR
jgi:hypothetical protein